MNRVQAKGGLAPWQLRHITDHLRANIAHDVSLQELAALADLSPTHLCRAFKQSTALPPHAWFVRLRIARARELMVGCPDMGIDEVARSVGYSGQAAVATAFRRVTGTTPSAWRRARPA